MMRFCSRSFRSNLPFPFLHNDITTASQHLTRHLIRTLPKTSIFTRRYTVEEKMENSFAKAMMKPGMSDPVPTYRVLEPDGTTRSPIDMSGEEVVTCYKGMVILSEMDKLMLEVQRQGLITFYMASLGEEAIHYGSAAALHPDDVVFAQYRETGVLMYRGFSVQNCVDQCSSNRRDLGKGRQIPVHYGSKKLNFQTISSPLGTQIPQAAGAGYALKQKGLPNITVCYFGEGAASEGDFHPGLNFAATLEATTLFICRNNKWSISTPSHEQYRGDAIAGRGVAYGIHTVRVDGNDFFAVYNATKEARRAVLEGGKPVLIEMMTYRVGHHSTSDDWSRYRDEKEVEYAKQLGPIPRLRAWLEKQKLWTKAEDDALITDAKAEVISALKNAEREKYPHIDHLFTDVYDNLNSDLIEQKKEMYHHLSKYPSNYPLDKYSSQL